MRVFVDFTEVSKMTVRAETEFEAMPRQMLDILTEAADNELAGHGYQNRTGNLEASTYAAPLFTSTSEATVEFGAREDYASYLEAKGLSQIDELAAEADQEIQFRLENAAKDIAG